MCPNGPKEIDLPSTKSEWNKLAKKVTIPFVEAKRRNGMTQEEKEALHEGEHPVHLALREVGGWGSASKVNLSHFLLARILFKVVPVEKLKDNGLLGITKKAQEICRDHLGKVDVDFTNFIDDITATGSLGPPPGKAANLGIYALVRHHQLMISRKADSSPEHAHGPAGGRRSLDVLSESQLSEKTELDDLSIQDASSIDHDTEEAEQAKLVLEEMLSNFSQQSAGYSNESFRSIGEDIVNVSLIDFLTTITMACPHVNLDWGHVKARIDLDLGKAKIRTINDGCLVSRSGDNIFAVAEAKPFRLTENPVPTVMQMGLKIMAHVYESEDTGNTKSRYFMFSQHFCEVYLTWANFDRSYMDYLRGANGVGASSRSFLNLKCTGPFNIYDSAHMFLLSNLVLNLTVQQSRDRKEEN